MKTAKRERVKQLTFEPRGLNNDQELEVEAIEQAGGNLANAAINFWTGIIYAQPFLKAAIDDALTRAAALCGIANPVTEDDRIEQLKKMLALYKATGADFKLPRELTAADHASALLNEASDDIPQDLFNLLADYFEQKIKATEHMATCPESYSLPSVKMVLAAGVAADRERGEE